MRPIVILLIFTFFIFDCRTTEGYRNKINQWIGNTETELVTAWGVPTGTYELEDGTKLLMYSSQSVGARPVFNGNQTIYVTTSFECKTTFTLKDKKVVDAIFQGNNCKD